MPTTDRETCPACGKPRATAAEHNVPLDELDSELCFFSGPRECLKVHGGKVWRLVTHLRMKIAELKGAGRER